MKILETLTETELKLVESLIRLGDNIELAIQTTIDNRESAAKKLAQLESNPYID